MLDSLIEMCGIFLGFLMFPILIVSFPIADYLEGLARCKRIEALTLREEWEAHHGVKPSLFRRLLNKISANSAKKDEVEK